VNFRTFDEEKLEEISMSLREFKAGWSRDRNQLAGLFLKTRLRRPRDNETVGESPAWFDQEVSGRTCRRVTIQIRAIIREYQSAFRPGES
jgi:hypothetical protein